jgi:hypothetical protein
MEPDSKNWERVARRDDAPDASEEVGTGASGGIAGRAVAVEGAAREEAAAVVVVVVIVVVDMVASALDGTSDAAAAAEVMDVTETAAAAAGGGGIAGMACAGGGGGFIGVVGGVRSGACPAGYDDVRSIAGGDGDGGGDRSSGWGASARARALSVYPFWTAGRCVVVAVVTDSWGSMCACDACDCVLISSYIPVARCCLCYCRCF